MNNRTTDHVRVAALKFFENLGIAKFLASASIKQKLAEGYKVHSNFFEEVKTRVPEDSLDFVQEVIDIVELTESEFNEGSLEFFQIGLGEIFMPASAFISVEEQIKELFQKEPDETMLLLLDEAMEDLTDQVSTDFVNLLNMRMAGIPMGVALDMLVRIGSGDVISGRVTVEPIDDDDPEHAEKQCHCNGECSTKCDCEFKDECEEAGHCMCED